MNALETEDSLLRKTTEMQKACYTWDTGVSMNNFPRFGVDKFSVEPFIWGEFQHFPGCIVILLWLFGAFNLGFTSETYRSHVCLQCNT